MVRRLPRAVGPAAGALNFYLNGVKLATGERLAFRWEARPGRPPAAIRAGR